MMRVLAVGRRSTGVSHPKLAEVVRRDFYDWSDADDALTGYDACFFTLGVSAAGMSEADYTRATYDLTLAAATALARLNPDMTFIYVSGAGTDSTERGRMMWARVKGRTENALLRLPFKAAYMFRPGMIEAVDGVRPRRVLAHERRVDVLESRIQPGKVFDRTTDLEGVPDGYRVMNDREAIKVMIEFRVRGADGVECRARLPAASHIGVFRSARTSRGRSIGVLRSIRGPSHPLRCAASDGKAYMLNHFVTSRSVVCSEPNPGRDRAGRD